MNERSSTDMEHQHHHHDEAPTEAPIEPRAFWEARYGERERIWSGAANRALVDVVSPLKPGSALDLGCGEGGDSLWLAEAGWQVTGADISATALERAAVQAHSRGLGAEAVSWLQVDLGEDFPPGTYDLVSACFLASPVQLNRGKVLRRAADAVTAGGTLLIVSHAAMPPWARHRHGPDEAPSSHGPGDFPTPAEELELLGLDEDRWTVVTAEVRPRQATGPEGAVVDLEDTVIVARRH